MDSGGFRQKVTHVPIAREGLPYVLSSAFATLVSAILGASFVAWPLLLVTLLMVHFFRDPDRICTEDPTEVVSPADGKVIVVERVPSTPLVQKPFWKMSIFMSVFDVHVNRIPCSGTVQRLHYQKGCFFAAHLAKAGRENEQNWLWVQSDSGEDILLTQVAGLIARRIVCWPRAGDHVHRGERFGMIRFGSRLDVYVPDNCDILVSRGNRVYGGETILCRLK